MALSRPEHVDLLASLHRGGRRTPPWSDFLGQLAACCAADEAELLICHDEIGDAARWAFSAAPRRESGRPALSTWPLETLRNLRPGRVYSHEEFSDARDGAHEPRHARAVRVAKTEGWSAWLTVFRATDDFSAADSALLSSLAPHVQIALENFALLERERMRATFMEHALASAGISWRLHDRAGCVLAQGSVTWPCAPAADEAHTLAQFGANQPRRGDAKLFCGADAEFAALPLSAPAIASTARVGTLTRTHHPLGANQARYFERKYSLSPKEARLAIAVANGKNLAEAASELGLTLETARNYSKRIYGKTGARGLPDLVRIVLSSLVAHVDVDCLSTNFSPSMQSENAIEELEA